MVQAFAKAQDAAIKAKSSGTDTAMIRAIKALNRNNAEEFVLISMLAQIEEIECTFC